MNPTDLMLEWLRPFLLPLAVKSTIILCAALLGALLLRKARASAAARHLNWLAAIVALLALPLLSAALPSLDLALLPERQLVAEAEQPTRAAHASPPLDLAAAGAQANIAHARLSSLDVPVTAGEPIAEPPSAPTGEQIALLIYAIVLACLLARLAIAQLALFSLRRRAWDVDDRQWAALVARLSRDLRLRRRVRLLIGPRSAMPMTWGTFRPTILLPSDALSWTQERLRFVLLHELAHVKRRDTLTQALAGLACAFFWFHPLVWHAAAQLRKEQEHACDDAVLNALGRPRTYARNLLELAGALEPAPLVGSLSVAMANSSEIEARMIAIIDRVRSRRSPSPRHAAAAGAALASLTLLLAAANPVRAASEADPHTGKRSAAAAYRNQPPLVVQRRVAAAPGATLTVAIATGGELSISGWDRDQVSLHAELRGRDRAGTRVELRSTGGGNVHLSARHAASRGFSTSHRFVLRVPRRYSVAVSSGGGGISLADLSGRFTGSTDGGSLTLARLEGEARLTTRGGDISVTDSNLAGAVGTRGGQVRLANVRGSLQALRNGSPEQPAEPTPGSALTVEQRGGNIEIDSAPSGARLVTGGGDIRLGSARLFVDAQTGAGDIILGSVDGAVTAVTGSGAASVGLAGGTSGAPRDVVIRSGSGPVTIVLQPGVGAEFDIETGYTASYGRPVRIITDLPLRRSESSTFEAVERGTPRRFVRAAGRVGNGHYRVRVRTVNGDVRIVHAASSRAPSGAVADSHSDRLAIASKASMPSIAAPAEAPAPSPQRWAAEDLRDEAVERSANERAAASLERTIWTATTTRSQVEAVESLTMLSSRAGIPGLARVARSHPSPAVRSAAVSEMGRVADARAVEMLSQIAFSDRDTDVQLRAVGALAATHVRIEGRRRTRPGPAGERLAAIAASHPNGLVRGKATHELTSIQTASSSPGA